MSFGIGVALYISSGALPGMARQVGLSSPSEDHMLHPLGQFSTSKAVAERCASANPKLSKFLVTYSKLTDLVAVRLKAAHPDWTQEQLQHVFDLGAQFADEEVGQVVDRETCDSPQVKVALQRFEVQADMEPSDVLAQ
ncbi:hypothetical protein [Nitrospirillum sp. BR 11163]|uniref:hypothetical protein n=1 Tax=Nitrospirillum sp. BR 11163 TaxID=3104323 RepID=UPI002AFFEA6A|nr:hypothetical protein [Nitrospirillum sp. BR 11163]MEA1677250.1 hypothetical protein [Nitrospirillum sp. BR 11163]